MVGRPQLMSPNGKELDGLLNKKFKLLKLLNLPSLFILQNHIYTSIFDKFAPIFYFGLITLCWDLVCGLCCRLASRTHPNQHERLVSEF